MKAVQTLKAATRQANPQHNTQATPAWARSAALALRTLASIEGKTPEGVLGDALRAMPAKPKWTARHEAAASAPETQRERNLRGLVEMLLDENRGLRAQLFRATATAAA